MQLTSRGQAILWSNLGVSFFPLAEGLKTPIQSWTEWQHRQPTKEEWEPWVSDGKRPNLAVVCGPVSAGLIVQDFEDISAAQEYYGPKWEKLLKTTLTIATPHNGIHVYYLSRQPCRRSIRISEDPPIDLLGEGGYAVSPPSKINHALCDKSKCHATGLGSYRVVSNDYQIRTVENVEGITLERCRELGWTSSSKKQRITEFDISQPISSGLRNETLFGLARLMLHKEKLDPSAVTDYLLSLNERRCQPPLDGTEVMTLVKSAMRYGGTLGEAFDAWRNSHAK